MLTQISIQNFKCFDSLLLPLGSLTMLTGFNAAGKSSSLQSLLLLAQAQRSSDTAAELPLNGSLTRLGTPGEVINPSNGPVVFGVEDNAVAVQWTMQADDRARGIALQITSIGIRDGKGQRLYDRARLKRMQALLPLSERKEARRLVERLRAIVFLSAVRPGTADVFPSPEALVPVHADVGIEGEFAPWWFQQRLDEKIDYNRCHPSDEAPNLRRQFNAWAGQLFPGAEGNATMIEKTNLVRLELRIGSIGDFRRPANIGYGLTYAFPVIIAGLLAKKGQILIIDSPEAHLHPMGQSQMGRFLVQVAASGVQVLVESHSDHVLNGVRLAVRDNVIEPEKVAIHFFTVAGHADERPPRVISPLIDRFGNLSEWPAGFFDQSEKDLAKLAGWT